MKLGEKIRQARLSKGLSQKTLCGDTITRNMLSQIENGSANPSMATLRQLASRLELPLSYFLEEQAFLSPNRELMEKARKAGPEEVLAILEDYQPGDCFDDERYLLEVLACFSLSEKYLNSRPAFALTLLAQAEKAGAKTPYYTPEFVRRHALLCYEAEPSRARELAERLPADPRETLLRAEAALQKGLYELCLALLNAVNPSPRWHLLKAQAHMARQEYRDAIAHYEEIATTFPREAYGALERCYLQLEDYKMAYFYADKGRNLL